jgi:hypothetical protein
MNRLITMNMLRRVIWSHQILMALAVLACLGSSGAAAAQSRPNSDVVPLDLVKAAFTMFGPGETTEILVGSIPEPLRSQLPIARGVQLLGTITMPFGTVVALTSSLSQDSLQRVVERSLEGKGYRRMSGVSQGGFASGAAPVASVWCSSVSYLMVRTQSPGVGRSTATIVLPEGQGRVSGCDAARPDSAMAQQIPTLYDPEGAHMTRHCTSSSGALAFMTQNRLETSLSPGELLDHYGRQLTDSGWTAVEGRGVTQSWSRQSPNGSVRYVTLAVSVPPDARRCRMIDLKMDGLK